MATGASAKGFGLPAKTPNTKVILNGGQRVTFTRPDGYFALYPTKICCHKFQVILNLLANSPITLIWLVLSYIYPFVVGKINARDGYSVLSKETVALIMCMPLILVCSWAYLSLYTIIVQC